MKRPRLEEDGDEAVEAADNVVEDGDQTEEDGDGMEEGKDADEREEEKKILARWAEEEEQHKSWCGRMARMYAQADKSTLSQWFGRPIKDSEIAISQAVLKMAYQGMGGINE